jgi:fusaric acid resistance family protein
VRAKQQLAISARWGVVTMAAVIASWESSLRLARSVDLGDDIVVLGVVMALMTSQASRRQASRWWLRPVVLPAGAVAAMLVGRLVAHHPDLGDAAFVIALSGSVWLRRFGPAWSSVGTLVALPFVALLVVPVPLAPGAALTAWPAVVSLVALLWVTLAQALARRAGWLPAPPAPQAAAAVRRTSRRLSASTRMAIQLGVGLAAAFVLGRTLYPDHWSWCVLSCYVVCSGNRGRGDVVHKGAARLVGALAGTLVATVVAGAFAPGDPTAIVLLFVVMACAVVLRPMGYGYWAAGVTAMLALLYGYYGQSGTEVLDDRLGGVLLGCLVAIAASWWVLPIRSNDVFRLRWAAALAALSDHLAALRAEPADDGAVESSARALRDGLVQLEHLEPSYRLHRRVTRRRAGTAHPVDLVVALREVTLALADVAALPVDVRRTPEHRRRLGAWARRVGVVRRRMRSGSAPEPPGSVPAPEGADAFDRAERAIATLDQLFVDEVWRRLGGRAAVSDSPHGAPVTNR